MRKKYVNRKTQKSMKTSAGDLAGLIKDAVKEAMCETGQKEDEEEEDETTAADIISDAVESVNKSRKDGEGISDDDVAELLEAVADAEEGKSDEGAADIGELLETAVEAVNEKRRAAKADGLSGEDVADLMEAVSEIMGDQDADGEEKGRKGTASSREQKSRAAGQTRRKEMERRYSSIYMQRPADTASGRKELPAGVRLARSIKCIDVWGRNDPERAAYYAQKNYGDMEMSRQFKALSVTGPENGGYLIPEVYMDEIIEMLYPKTVIFDLGARKVPLDNGNLNIPKMTAGTRATWGGEQRRISKTAPKYGNIRLSAKRLGAIVPQSRELLMSTSYSSDALFGDDLMRRMQLGLDFGGLYGTGGENMPMGIACNTEVEKIDVSKMTNPDLVTDGKITADFPVFVRAKIMQKNVDDQSLGWVFNAMMEGYLMNMKTNTGTYIYRDEMQTGKLMGAPYRISNQISVSTDGKTDMFFGNWADLLIGDQMGMETYTTLDGSWVDDEGTTHSAFEENLVATRATMYDDIAVRHGESFLVCKNIRVM